jgi:hypothetical protein
MATPPQPRRGRPPAGKPRHPSVNTTVPPEVEAWLKEIADGSASRGSRMILVREYEKAKKKETRKA